MKHLFLSACFSCLALWAYSQTWHRAIQPDFTSEIFQILPDPYGELLIVTASGPNSSFRPVVLNRIDSGGTVTNLRLPTPGIPFAPFALPFHEGYLVTDYFFECDILLSRWIGRFDTSGQEIWSLYLDATIAPPDEAASLLPGTDTTFWLFRQGQTPILFGLSGTILGYGPTPQPVFKGIAGKTGQGYITYGANGLHRYSANLQTITSALVSHEINDAKVLTGGQVLAITNSSWLFRLDTDLLPIDSLNLSDYGIPAQLAITGANLVKVMMQSGNTLVALNADLTLDNVFVTQPNGPPVPEWIFGTPEHWLLIGRDRTNNLAQPSQAIGITANDPDQYNFFDPSGPDAGVVGITADSVIAFPSTFSPTSSVYAKNVRVTIKNYGDHPLYSTIVNADIGSFSYICTDAFQYSFLLNDINLAPGDTTTVTLGNFNKTQFGTPATFTLCLWTSTANDSLDASHINASTCENFPIKVDAYELLKPSLSVAVFPNPTRHATTVQWGEGAALLQLFNLQGLLVYETTGNGGSFTLAEHGWQPGSYLWVVRKENGHFGRAIVIYEE